MKRFFLFAAAAVCMVLAGCNGQQGHTPSSIAQVSEPADTVVPVVEVPFREKLLTAADVTLTKDLLTIHIRWKIPIRTRIPCVLSNGM